MYGQTAPNVPTDLTPLTAWVGEAFGLWQQQWQVYAVQGLIFCGISAAVGMVPYAGGFASMFISAWLLPGMVLTALKQIRGQPIAIGDLFSAGHAFLAALVLSFLVNLGIFACCIGVFVSYGIFLLGIPLAVDRNLQLGDTITLTWQAGTRNIWFFMLFGLLAGLMASIGIIGCVIGIFVTMPIVSIAQAVAYEHIFGPSFTGQMPFALPVGSTLPPPPPYNPGVGSDAPGPVNFLKPAPKPSEETQAIPPVPPE